jgi:peptide/nickel transport system substrate-binding protein
MLTSVNPTRMEEDILGAVPIMPAAEWAKDSASGPTLDFTQPANALKIFNFLTAQTKAVSTYATNPLWQTVDGPYKLSSFNETTGAFAMVPGRKPGDKPSADLRTNHSRSVVGPPGCRWPGL